MDLSGQPRRLSERHRRCATCLLLVLALLLAGCVSYPASPTPTPTVAPTLTPAAQPLPTATPTLPPPAPLSPIAQPRIEHLLLISVDGLRPDALFLAAVPNMARLWQGGAYSWHAQTILPSATLQAHTAMLTGLPPEVTGVTWNTWSPGEPYVGFITVLGLAHASGLNTGAIVGKAKLEFLFPPESVDKLVVTYGDERVAQAAAETIVQQRPALLFVHRPGVDAAGHSNGWLSPQQLQAVEQADTAVGR